MTEDVLSSYKRFILPCIFDCVKEFFCAFVRKAEITLHIKKLSGENSHHISECAFKAVARALKEAVKTDEKYKDEIPSTKGVL